MGGFPLTTDTSVTKITLKIFDCLWEGCVKNVMIYFHITFTTYIESAEWMFFSCTHLYSLVPPEPHKKFQCQRFLPLHAQTTWILLSLNLQQLNFGCAKTVPLRKSPCLSAPNMTVDR